VKPKNILQKQNESGAANISVLTNWIPLDELNEEVFFEDISVIVDGALSTIKSLSSSNNRNGYISKQLSANREFAITTRRLFNHNTQDVKLMQALDNFHLFPYHYFTFWEIDEAEQSELVV
jgi:hypothetical protein